MKRLEEIFQRCEAAPEGWADVIESFPDAINYYKHARADLPIVVKALQKAVGALTHIRNGDCDQDCYEERARFTIAEITAMLDTKCE